ncbi:MAG TPA: FliA/WhiG family RNA polymerase sigma factor [Candidatus Acidoferrales bacterium]|nr:FliA/WhiG family RNA polymerase sigma factor [Candidatus Acidoferrales bacterium]
MSTHGYVPRTSVEERSMEGRAAETAAPLGFDPAQREELVLEHLAHVHYIARRIHCRLPPQVRLEDLVNAGVVGLLDAVAKYDPAKNVKLKAYAEFRIRGAILDSLRAGDWSPRALRRQGRRLEEAISTCQARLGHAPNDQEIAAELQMSLIDLQCLLRDLDGLEIEDLQGLVADGRLSNQDSSSHSDDDPFSVTVRSEMTRLLMNAIAELSERERQVLALHHFKDLPMKAVGSVLGIGKSRVSQIHSTALLHLRAQLTEVMSPRPSRIYNASH